MGRALIVKISDRTWQGHQSWNRERIESFNEAKLRYRIKVDAYPEQSYARAERWDGDKWRTVHFIDGHVIATKVSYVTRDVKEDAFAADLAELQRVARAVLS